MQTMLKAKNIIKTQFKAILLTYHHYKDVIKEIFEWLYELR